jgi:hypothetical protein
MIRLHILLYQLLFRNVQDLFCSAFDMRKERNTRAMNLRSLDLSNEFYKKLFHETEDVKKAQFILFYHLFCEPFDIL